MKPGDVVGRYRLVAPIGEGGMGSVFRAFDEKLQRTVALKLIKLPTSSAAVRAEARERFLREARALAALTDPRIVTVHEVGDVDGEPFLVMELVRGKNLGELVGDDRVDLADRLRWLRGLAEALAAVHRAGIIHRDIKPDNVIVTTAGDIKLIDFGIARAGISESDGTSSTVRAGLGTLTSDGATVGTPLYMAPEQVRGEAVGPAADQFAWAVTAYELLAGRLPWSGEGSLQILSAILERDPLPLAPDLAPDHVVRCILRALSKREDDRFASMTEVVRALDGHGDEAPVPRPTPPAVKSPASEHDVPVRHAGARWRPWAAGAVLLSAAVAGLVMMGRDGGEPAADPTSASSNASATPPTDTRAPLRVRDLPIPSSKVDAAREAYAEGVRAFATDGSTSATRPFEEAAALDPEMAAARVRLLVIGSWNGTANVALYDEARRHEASLSARDIELLDVLEPVYRLDPTDRHEARRRSARLLERRPADAELLLLHVFGLGVNGDREALVELERVLAVDPTLPDALGGRVQMCAYRNDADCVTRSEQACLEHAPTSMTCLYFRSEQAEERGDCRALEVLGRSMRQNGSGPFVAYRQLLEGMASTGRPRASLEATLAAAKEGGELSADAYRVISMEARIAALFGDFVVAEEQVTRLEVAASRTRAQSERGKAVWLRVEAARESGDGARAVELARAHLDVRDALLSDTHVEDFALTGDMAPMLLRALGEGAAGGEAWSRRRDVWLDGWGRRLQGTSPSYVWLHGWAGSVFDAKTAREALAARSRYLPLAGFRPRSMTELNEGRVFAELGRWEEAAERLRKATSVCRAFSFPFEHVQAHELYGRVLEKKGDEARACAAYRYVVERWGDAKPRSVTAEKARERMTALKCASPK